MAEMTSSDTLGYITIEFSPEELGIVVTPDQPDNHEDPADQDPEDPVAMAIRIFAESGLVFDITKRYTCGPAATNDSYTCMPEPMRASPGGFLGKSAGSKSWLLEQ